MPVRIIDASPTKELFIDTLIRDISVIDAILDLVDNAIDGYIHKSYTDRKKIKITLSTEKFQIWDNCGGIDIDFAQKEVFRFGVPHKPEDKHCLGVFGIGLKRAIFKLGRNVVFESDDLKNYFRVKIDLKEWQEKKDWTLEFDDSSLSKGSEFTKILITCLHDEVKEEAGSNRFKNLLHDRISKTYFLFIKNNVDISLDGKIIKPFALTIGFSKNIEPAHKSFEVDGVRIKLTAGAHPDYRDPGWYIFCNERLIIPGDRTALTGWGNRGVPNYHPKFNRFKGFAFFDSDDPTKLPWNTAKNGIDVSSPIDRTSLNEMQTITQQYTSFMSKAYPTDREETIGKEILGDLDTKPALGIE